MKVDTHHLICIAAELRVAEAKTPFPTCNSRADAVVSAAAEIDAWRLVNDPKRVEEVVALGDFERRLADLRHGYDAMVERVAAMSDILKRHGIPEPGER